MGQTRGEIAVQSPKKIQTQCDYEKLTVIMICLLPNFYIVPSSNKSLLFVSICAYNLILKLHEKVKAIKINNREN